MLFGRRPQSPGCVNRVLQVFGLWRWLDDLMFKTHRQHQFYPSRFYLRGIFIGLLIVVPAVLWVRSFFQKPSTPLERWSQGRCPAQPPVAWDELFRAPERFRHRTIWLVGQIDKTRAQCISSPCLPGTVPCCQPCQAQLILRESFRSFRSVALDGWLPVAQGLPQRLLCRGTTCKFSCDPIQYKQWYAVEGSPRVDLLPTSTSLRPQFRFRHFQVIRLCPLGRAYRAKSSLYAADPNIRTQNSQRHVPRTR